MKPEGKIVGKSSHPSEQPHSKRQKLDPSSKTTDRSSATIKPALTQISPKPSALKKDIPGKQPTKLGKSVPISTATVATPISKAHKPRRAKVSTIPITDGSVAKTKRFRKKVKPVEVVKSALPVTDLRDPMLSQAMSSNWAALKMAIGATGAGRAISQAPAKSADEPMRTLPGPIGTSVEITQVLAMDCEMVGVGRNGERSALARVAVVNNDGNVLLDEYVATKETVTDYRTKWSGIRPIHLADAPPFEAVVARVAALLDKRTLVGHALHNDLHVLLLSHPKKDIRDTARYPPLMKAASVGRKPRPQALRVLAAAQLGLVIQEGEHTPVDDARAALYLYHKHNKEWEAAVKGGRSHQGASAALNAQGCKVVSKAGQRLRLRKVAGAAAASESGKVPTLASVPTAGSSKAGGKGGSKEGKGGIAVSGKATGGLSNYLQYDVRNDPMADL